jgi:hypothetical protein
MKKNMEKKNTRENAMKRKGKHPQTGLCVLNPHTMPSRAPEKNKHS